MKKNYFVSVVALSLVFFFASCDDENVYEQGDTGNTGDTADTGDSADTGDTADTSDTGDTSDTADTGDTPDDDVADTGEGEPDSDTDDSDTGGDDDTYIPPAGSCEEILYCIAGCADFDDNCKVLCVTYGDDAGQQNYNNWKNCYDSNCSTEQTAECSERECPAESAACAVSKNKPVHQPFPAPYGAVKILAEFNYIVKDGFPAGDNEFISQAFVTGKISKIRVDATSAEFLFSFVNLTNDGTDDIFEIIQIPMMADAKTIVNPVSRLTFKTEKASKGVHGIGINSSYDSILEVFHITNDGETVCHYAFGFGEFTISRINPVSGSEGYLSVSSDAVELYSPRNFPEFGGDISSQMDVISCSLIK